MNVVALAGGVGGAKLAAGLQDVLPAGDLGIVNAIQRLYRLRKRPDAKRVLKIGEAWKPYRSVASWYLWQTLRNEPLSRAADTPRQSPRKSRAR